VPDDTVARRWSTSCSWNGAGTASNESASIPQVAGCFIDADSLEDARYRIRRALWITDRDAGNAVLGFERVRHNGLANEPLFVETRAEAAEAEAARQAEAEARARAPLPTIRAGEPLARHPSFALSYGLSYEGPVRRRQVLVQLDDLLVHQLDG
jgi:hypothetical protein